MLRKIKFGLWVVTFVASSVASLSVVWGLVSGGLSDVVGYFGLNAVVVACLALAGPVCFAALSLERIAGDRKSVGAIMDLAATATQKAADRARASATRSGGDGGT